MFPHFATETIHVNIVAVNFVLKSVNRKSFNGKQDLDLKNLTFYFNHLKDVTLNE